MQSVKDIFHYLERTVLIKEINQERSSFWMMALAQVSKRLTPQIKGSLKSGVLRLIKLDRQSDHLSMFSDESHRDLIAKLIHVMLALGLYKQDFEHDFLAETASFFQKDSNEKLGTMDLAGYLNYVEKVLKDELHRV